MHEIIYIKNIKNKIIINIISYDTINQKDFIMNGFYFFKKPDIPNCMQYVHLLTIHLSPIPIYQDKFSSLASLIKGSFSMGRNLKASTGYNQLLVCKLATRQTANR
jgi:hypothetical protein